MYIYVYMYTHMFAHKFLHTHRQYRYPAEDNEFLNSLTPNTSTLSSLPHASIKAVSINSSPPLLRRTPATSRLLSSSSS